MLGVKKHTCEQIERSMSFSQDLIRTQQRVITKALKKIYHNQGCYFYLYYDS